MSQPFYQPARQNFSSSQSMQQPQGGFGGFGGYQMPQQSFGGGQGFGGFGGGQGFGFGGGQAFGGFGGFGGSFQPQGFGGFGGGYNPMFGGIGSLGFNPMMGQGFGMPMQGFNPYQQHVQLQQPQQNPFAAQDAELTSQMQSAPEYQAFENARKSWEGSEGYKSYQQKRQDLVRQMQESQRQPMYGGIGGLGFNPMMGPQFGMPMQGFNPMMGQQFSSDHMGDMMSRGGPEMSRLSELQRGLARQQEYSPIMGLQFGMPIQRPFNPFGDSGMGAENARSARENMRNMSPAQRQEQQVLLQQLQGFGVNSPQGRAMLG